MKRSRFSEEQIIGILKEHQAGLGAKELSQRPSFPVHFSYSRRYRLASTNVHIGKAAVRN